MSDARFQQYLARFQNARLNRRALVQGAAAAAVALPTGAGAHRVGAAPLGAPRRQIDARTLVIADDLRPGAQWLSFDPAWIYEIHAAAGHNLHYAQLYGLPDSNKPDEFVPLLAADFPQLSEDGLEVTIPLRPGGKFHSGNEMT